MRALIVRDEHRVRRESVSYSMYGKYLENNTSAIQMLIHQFPSHRKLVYNYLYKLTQSANSDVTNGLVSLSTSRGIKQCPVL